MKTFFKISIKQLIISLFLFTLCIFANSQNSIDLNATGGRNLQGVKIVNDFADNLFKEADRYRQFDYNKQLANLSIENIGDTLLLNFFEDKQYKAVIQRITTSYVGRTSITTKIADTDFAWCYMVVSDATISFSAELPLQDECFFGSVKEGQAYISQRKLSEYHQDLNLSPDDALQVPDSVRNKKTIKPDNRNIDDPVTIDLLYVYTPAAEQYALNHSYYTDIFDIIDISLQVSNQVVDNSDAGITFEIAYIHLTEYVETNTENDLYRITDPTDGYMDEVHLLRDYYYADLIVFLPNVTFVGGIAWLLWDENGFGEYDYGAVSLSSVRSAASDVTIHEIGHNMGCHHHHQQNDSPGPGLFPYSSGWRGNINGDYLCTVMTYENGVFFADGRTHLRIPYFSSPDIIIDGVIIGDEETENNTLTLKKTKTPSSNYRTNPGYVFCDKIVNYPYSDSFENVGTIVPDCWRQEYVLQNHNWIFTDNNGSFPPVPYDGNYMAVFKNNDFESYTTKLISPQFDFTFLINPTLKFRHIQAESDGNQDELRIFYKTSLFEEWILLEEYIENITTWTERTINLPNQSANYYIAFEGTANNGHGVVLDDIQVIGEYAYPPQNIVAEIVNDNVEITWDAPQDDLNYSVYRLIEGQPESLWTMLSNNTTTTSYSDTEWSSLTSNIFQYAVKARYTEIVTSKAALSDTLHRNMYLNYQINITTNLGESPIGAIVILTNQDGNPEHIYTATSDDNGALIENVWKGIYNITITHNRYKKYKYNSIEVSYETNLYYNVTLEEIDYPPIFIVAHIENDNAIIDWDKPMPPEIFRYDSGFYLTAYGFAIPSPRGVYGSCHRENAILTKMSWYINASHTEINLFIFSLDEQGQPTNNIIYSALDVPNIRGWNNYDFPEPVYASGGFFMALSHNTSHLSLAVSRPTLEYPFMYNTQFASLDYLTGIFSDVGYSNIGKLIFMIRAEGYINGEEVKIGYSDSTDFLVSNNLSGYIVYRLINEQPEDEWTLLSNNITETNFTDTEWESLPYGVYQYAVKALYANGIISEPALSDILLKDMYIDFHLNITTNTGVSPAGAIVTLTNTNDNSEYVYTATSDDTGVLIDEIWRGFYDLTITLDGFQVYFETNLDITLEEQSHNVMLSEIAYPPISAKAELAGSNAYITWKGPNNLTEQSFILDDDSAETGYRIGNNLEFSLGNFFIVNSGGVIKSIDVYGHSTGSTNRTVIADIYDEQQVLVGSSAPFILPDNQWINVPLDNIPYSNAFYAMVRWTPTAGDTNELGYDTNGTNSNEQLSWWRNSAGNWVLFHQTPAGQEGVFMIRLHVLEYGDNDKNILNQKGFSEEYIIYRLEEGQPEENWTQLSNNVSEAQFTDSDWYSLLSGYYQYAIRTKYTGDVLSKAGITNKLGKDVSIKEDVISDFILYPNPFTNEIVINSEFSIKNIWITNAVGQEVKELIFNGNSIVTGNLSSGVYFVTIESQNGEKVVYKMVKK
ncbi:MAG: M12 family metallo-peptidase [Marinilabiliaceae bacterium]|nr:M12 family metallo-peptidase [Marinilabiliaceae bacterium]